MSAPTSSVSLPYEETAVPTLKVMRLQSPDLEQPSSGSLDSKCLLGSALSLPDSFGVIHVGETFTAYLGALNVSQNLMVRRLTVTAQLQTPSQRCPLPSTLDGALGVDVRPGDGVDAIVSKQLEEAGQHILRVELGYQTSEGTLKTLRKFYRFNVASPLGIKIQVIRSGDNVCIVAVAMENLSNQAMVIKSTALATKPGLEATRIGNPSSIKNLPASATSTSRASDMFDKCGLLEPKASIQYLFRVETLADYSRGIACGDELGHIVLQWYKTMGELGKLSSAPIVCPTVEPGVSDMSNPTKIMMGTGSDFVVHQSGLSVDIAKLAASRAAGTPMSSNLDQVFPVTVEPLDPPASLTLATPQEVKFLVVNHSPQTFNLQLQFRLNHMSGVAICGKSFKNLGEVSPSGGSAVASMRLVPLVAGLLRVQGCCIVDLTTGKEIPQPPLFNIFANSLPMEQHQ